MTKTNTTTNTTDRTIEAAFPSRRPGCLNIAFGGALGALETVRIETLSPGERAAADALLAAAAR